jgi:hypothetical protein
MISTVISCIDFAGARCLGRFWLHWDHRDLIRHVNLGGGGGGVVGGRNAVRVIVEPAEPRLHSFYGYAAPDSDYVTIVQVHPDADSMATHMKVGTEHFATAYAEYLEPETTLQIYGNLTEDLIRTISAAAQTDGEGSSVTIREPFSGFDRLPHP